MDLHEEKKEILRKYYKSIPTSTVKFYMQEEIPEKMIEVVKKSWVPNLVSEEILGFCETSLSGKGKNGFLFTDNKVYYLQILEKTKKIWYDDIKDVVLAGYKDKDCNKVLQFTLYDGTVISWDSIFLNKTPLLNYFQDMLELINDKQQYDIDWSSEDTSINYNSLKFPGSEAGGIALSEYNETNKSFEEEKFHASQGHGYAAERANNLYDKLTGHDARIVGDDNAKNGADRIVDGVYIQSKYCATGSRCINECFDSEGNFRYLKDGKPMQIEVPSDKYEDAIKAMQEKIKNGKIPGVTDPAEAENIVRKGHFTYEQAKNIARFGTVESLTYDAVNGIIIATSAFGVTAAITFVTNIWNGEDFDKSIKLATFSGLKVGGTAFATTIIASQLSKAGLNSALVASSEAIVAMMGPKAAAILINAFRSGSKIYGAAAMKSAAKLLRGNAITAGVTFVVLSTADIVNIFRGRISGKQLFKNLTNTAATVGGGTAGWLGGAALGSAVFPGVGTVIGGVVGATGAGVVAEKLSDTIIGHFIEDDAVEMVQIIQDMFAKLAEDYLLNQKEAEKSIDKLSEILNGKILKNMFASNDRIEFAQKLLIPIIENEVSKRRFMKTVSTSRMVHALKDILEEYSEEVENGTTFKK